MRKNNYAGLSAILNPLEKHILQAALFTDYSGVERAVIIFDTDPPDLFNALQALVRFIRRNHLPEPWILNREFVLNSQDSYPLEYLNMLGSYRNIECREDILATLKFSPADIRLQMERELRGKWLLTRQAILENPFKLSLIRNVILNSRMAIYPVLKGFFCLKALPVPAKLDDAIAQAGDIAGLDLSALKHPITGIDDANQYLDMLNKLMKKVQDWKA